MSNDSVAAPFFRIRQSRWLWLLWRKQRWPPHRILVATILSLDDKSCAGLVVVSPGIDHRNP
jgi:hypothetical protein